MKTVKLIVSILFGLLFLISGLNKLFPYMPMPDFTESQMEMFGHFMAITWLFPLVAVVEIIGAILFVIPKWRALGALIVLPITVGIILHHITIEPSGLILTIVLFGINIWIIADNWNKYKNLGVNFIKSPI
ncbi:MAG: DoxX family protein [Bacteroidota bacterium]